ncbi:MAG: hypothetical protein RIS43_703, partial [Actinomycetota bacterium]
MKQTTLKLIAALSIAVMGFGSLAPAEAATYNKRITIHYHRQAGDFSGWYAWMWQYKKTQPAAYTFKSTTQYWTTGTFTVANSSKAKTIAFYMGQARGLPKDTYNQTRYIKDFTSKGRAEIWIVQGDPEIYTYEPDVIPRIQSAKIDAMNKITVSLNLPFGNVVNGNANGFTITGPGGITVTDVDANEAGTQLTLTTSANLTLSGAYTLHHNKYIDNPLQIGQVLTSDSFNELYIYDGDDLGNTYTPERTDFRVWAPTASEAKLLVYADAAPSTTPTETAMTASVNGTWIAHLDGDQDGTIYTYKVKIGENWNEAVDPYVRTSTVNGQRGVVVDLTSTDPAGFRESTSPEFSGELSDAIFYELHVRDLSMDDSSGIPDQYKGKFLALTQAGTETPDGLSKTGIDAIADLGVTHLQLLPIYDYNSVDETTRDQFNWGYDPLNYNVVEGSYATNPEDPKNRVNELKQTVQYIHSRGLRVIMDVVYNHV